jgi:hypothetical protein
VIGRRIAARVVVVSPNAVASPLTGMRAVFFEWTLFVRSRRQGMWGNTRASGYEDEAYDEIGRAGHGHDFLVETTERGRCDRIRLQANQVRYRVAHPGDFGPLLQQQLPGELQHLLPRDPPGPIHLRELPLTKGDVVTLRAVVVPHGPRGELEGPLLSEGPVDLEERVPGRSRLRRFLEALRWVAR